MRPGGVAAGVLAFSGTMLVGGAAVLWLTSTPAVPAAAGQVPGTTATEAAPQRPAPRQAPPRVSPSKASPPKVIQLPGSRPAPVVTARTDGRGRLDPPNQVSDVGWWPGGAAPGSPAGTIVLTGHVDLASQGIGVFARLRDLHVGDRIGVTAADGREFTYRVTGWRSYPRSEPLPAQVFSARTAPRLALITCTGRFDEATAHYSDSLVVYAVPAPATAPAAAPAAAPAGSPVPPSTAGRVPGRNTAGLR